MLLEVGPSGQRFLCSRDVGPKGREKKHLKDAFDDIMHILYTRKRLEVRPPEGMSDIPLAFAPREVQACERNLDQPGKNGVNDKNVRNDHGHENEASRLR